MHTPLRRLIMPGIALLLVLTLLHPYAAPTVRAQDGTITFNTPEIVNLTTDASCYEAVQRMRGAGADCVLVQDSERRVVGILTARDVVQRVAFTAHPELPITEAMSRPVFTMSAETPIYRGLAQMHRFRR